MDSEQLNKTYHDAMEQYEKDMIKIESIKERIHNGINVSASDILWLCDIATDGINQQKYSWFE